MIDTADTNLAQTSSREMLEAVESTISRSAYLSVQPSNLAWSSFSALGA